MNESQFLTEMRKSFEAIGSFAYKIPDSGNMVGKFTLAKPFDMVAEVKGQLIGIEAKVQLNGKGWATNKVTDNQKLGLSKVEKYGNKSYVFLCWKPERGVYYFVMIPFRSIKGRKSISQKELRAWPYKIKRDNKNQTYDLTEFFKWVRMGL